MKQQRGEDVNLVSLIELQKHPASAKRLSAIIK